MYIVLFIWQSTVGIDFNVKDLERNGVHYRLQMWDTAGQERYRSLIPTYLKNAHCVVFVFDIAKAKTLEGLADWYKLFTDNQQAPGIVVANKIDLTIARYLLFYVARCPRPMPNSSVRLINLSIRKFRPRVAKKLVNSSILC